MCLLGILDFLFGTDYEDDYEKELDKNINNEKNSNYKKKIIMSEYEKYFYNIISENLDKKYIIFPQVNLASIIDKEKKLNNQYQNELYRNIDFGIFEKNTMKIKLLIEINDKTHNQIDRKYRDYKVKNICKQANINLITFYTNYPNKKDYVIKRINDNLK